MKAGRHWLFLSLLLAAAAGLVFRAVDLHLIDSLFLLEQGNARSLRTITVNAHRGMIRDRNGEPLAVSTPVSAIWLNPAELQTRQPGWGELVALLQISSADLQKKISGAKAREFLYLKRNVEPDIAQKVKDLGLSGVYSQREYRRYYPLGEVAGHLIGFANIDDHGQEGLELTFDEQLAGIPGEQKIIKDRRGRWVEPVSDLVPPSPGQDLYLSIDRRLQHLAYRELKLAVHQHQALSGSLVLLDSNTGEVLAMANQPAFNPNARDASEVEKFRNRAVTDQFEPGSTAKPFTLALALALGKHQPDSRIETGPGFFYMGGHQIKDFRNYGNLSLQEVLQKSSNVGAAKVALEMSAEQLWQIFDRFGFGLSTGSGFPGEASGHLPLPAEWKPIDQATMAYGYGLSVTPLQLARAYAVFANGGYLPPVSFVRLDKHKALPRQSGQRVLPEQVASQILTMLESVVSPAGTGNKASVPGYRIAGKTGTTHLASVGGYDKKRYAATFVGIAPASKPRLVMVVTIKEPAGGKFYGGDVAAPVFGHFMNRALPVLGIPHDGLHKASGCVAGPAQSLGQPERADKQQEPGPKADPQCQSGEVA